MQTLFIISLLMITPSMTVFDFTKKTNDSDWQIVDDRVMGGKSNGYFKINEAGNGLFYGDVSLENNGGFSSLRHVFSTKEAMGYKKVVLHIKGDGKRYQFRIKSAMNDYHSYIQFFETSGAWEKIEIDLKDFYPSFRGRKLDMPNYNGQQMEEIRFLIANKTAESFALEIDRIELR